MCSAACGCHLLPEIVVPMLVAKQAPAWRPGGRALPSSWVTTFDDPDRYQAMLRGADCEVLLNHGGGFKVELTRVDLERLWMQRSRCHAAPPIVRAALDPSRVAVLFASDTDHGPMHHNGIDLSSSEIVLHSRGDTIYNWAPGPTHWAAMSLTHDDFVKPSQAKPSVAWPSTGGSLENVRDASHRRGDGAIAYVAQCDVRTRRDRPLSLFLPRGSRRARAGAGSCDGGVSGRTCVGDG